MNIAQMTARVRRRVNEGTANRFSDADIEGYINDAWRELKTKITVVRPEEFVETWRTNLVSGTSDYARQNANERALRIYNTSLAKYVPIQPIDWVKLQEWDLNSSIVTGTYRYAHFGQAYRIRPIPSSSITDGLEVEFLALDSAMEGLTADTATPTCPEMLHPYIVHRAVLLAFDDSGESGSEAQGRAEAEWDKVDGMIAIAYLDIQGTPFGLAGG